MSLLPGLLLKGKNENKYNLERAGYGNPNSGMVQRGVPDMPGRSENLSAVI
jgi:hypothetical protein